MVERRFMEQAKHFDDSQERFLRGVATVLATREGGQNSNRPSKGGTLDKLNSAASFHPQDVSSLLEEPQEMVPYVVDGYLAEGGLTLLAGPPKVGKTTLAYHAVIQVATGRPWLNRVIRRSKVLVLALEEHRREVIRRFWAADDPQFHGQIKIVTGVLPFTEDLLKEVTSYIQEEGIGLVLVDTLHAWWGVEDENSSSEVLRSGGLLLQAVRRTPAAWLCLVHTRKSGGDFGQEIRGSSALVGLVDVALSLKRTEGNETQRCLEAVSRYSETPAKLVIGLGEQGYSALGSPEDVGQQAKTDKVRAALSQLGQQIKDLTAATGLSKQDVSRALGSLGDVVTREGTGHRGDPYRYRLNSICPTNNPRGGTLDESNSDSQIRFVQPPVPLDESNNGKEEVIDLAH